MRGTTDRDGRRGGARQRAGRGLVASALAHAGALLLLYLGYAGREVVLRGEGGRRIVIEVVDVDPRVDARARRPPPRRAPTPPLPRRRPAPSASSRPRVATSLGRSSATGAIATHVERGESNGRRSERVPPRGVALPAPEKAAAEIVLGPGVRDPAGAIAEGLTTKLREGMTGLPDDGPEPVELDRDDEGNLVFGDVGMAEHLWDVTIGKALESIQSGGPGYDEDQLWGSYEPFPGRSPIKATIRPTGEVDFDLNRGLDLPGVDLPPLRGPLETCPAWACREAAEAPVSKVVMRPLQDFNDLAAMALGDDPHAARKRRFLRQTEELRDRLAEEDRRGRLGSSDRHVARHLREVWQDDSLSMAAKRQVLFELWDECYEPADEEALTGESVAGRSARRRILTFLRRRLPAGTASSYTASELARLNARRQSREVFDPYGRGP